MNDQRTANCGFISYWDFREQISTMQWCVCLFRTLFMALVFCVRACSISCLKPDVRCQNSGRKKTLPTFPQHRKIIWVLSQIVSSPGSACVGCGAASCSIAVICLRNCVARKNFARATRCRIPNVPLFWSYQLKQRIWSLVTVIGVLYLWFS